MKWGVAIAAVAVLLFVLCGHAHADWPAGEKVWEVMTLQQYNTRIVVIGVAILGVACGVIGSFLLLRKRSLMGDALSHATLPGIAAAFMIATVMGYSGKALPVLLLGAVVTGLLGMGLIAVVQSTTRLKQDAALGIVLSVFFGAGVALLGVVQHMQRGHAAGLESFIYGKTASMVAFDAQLIAGAALAVVIVSVLLFKELTLLCFDQDFAATSGFRVVLLDAIMMALVVAVTVIGLQAVGLILIVALLITPAAAARFWTRRLGPMVVIAAVIGGISGWSGALLSALTPKLPAGAVIVLCAGSLFVLSMLLGTQNGVVLRWVRQRRWDRQIRGQNLLRAMYEAQETSEAAEIRTADLRAMATWTPAQLQRDLKLAAAEGFVERRAGDLLRLTPVGQDAAQQAVRNHRLWELYLINYADIAPANVDRQADMVEHVLGRETVAHLEQLAGEQGEAPVPASPHG